MNFLTVYRQKMPWVRMRAVDTFEKLVRNNPGLVRPYLPSIFTDLTKSSQPSVQWHVAQIFTEVELSKRQQADAIIWLKGKITSVDVDWIVSVNVSFDINEEEWSRLRELLPKFEALDMHKPTVITLGGNINAVGGQNVSHAHLHLIGRFDDEPWLTKACVTLSSNLAISATHRNDTKIWRYRDLRNCTYIDIY